MKLITSACSFGGHTTHPHVEGESWTVQLGKRLNLSESDIVNMGLGGCSLDYIHRSILHGVIDHLGNDIIVVVGWTSISRWEHFADKSGKCQANPSEPYHYNAQAFWGSTLNEEREYKQHMMNHTLFQEYMRRLNMIISLAGFLNQHNIKYLFFPAFEPLDSWAIGSGYASRSETGQNCPVLNKLTNYIRENVHFLEQTQIEIGAKEGHSEKVRLGLYDGNNLSGPYIKKEYFTDDGWHPSELAHIEWSEILHRELNKRWEL